MANNENEVNILRDLGRRLAAIAAAPVQIERIDLWKRFHRLTPARPMVLAYPEGGWRDLIPDSVMQCHDPVLRNWEWMLRERIYHHERLQDDHPVTNVLHIGWQMERSDFGMHEDRHRTEDLGAFKWDPPLKDPADLAKLHTRSIKVDRDATQRTVARAKEVFDGILDVRLDWCWPPSGQFPNTMTMLRGLEQVMMDMYDSPQFLHDFLSLLLESAMKEMDYMEAQGLLELNNLPDSYTGTGGVGCTDLLPAAGMTGRPRAKDLWGLAESQEYALVGPRQFYEFGIQYQAKLMARYGFVYYGCCEALHDKLDTIIEHIPNLRAVSISPWCDVKIAAEKLRDRFIFAWKPNPALICGPQVRWDEVEADMRRTLEIARGCVIEIVMKDTHTFCGDPTRIERWVKLARKLADEFAS